MFKHIKWQARYFLYFSFIILQGCAVTHIKDEQTGQKESEHSGTFAILSINDVYRIDGLQSGVGGLARLRTLRQELEKTYPDLLMLHGGDLLFPSFLSRQYSGEHMIDVLNMMDGVDPGFDPRMFVVFGNHEFDKKSIEAGAQLKKRIRASDFNWLSTNIEFKPSYKFKSHNMGSHFMIDVGNVKVGIFGLTIQTDSIAFASVNGSLEKLKKIAVKQTNILKRQGADFVIALTHLEKEDDLKLLKLERGPDMIIGGHDHAAVDQRVNGRCVLKADADAKTARVTTVTIGPEKEPVINTKLVKLTPSNYKRDQAVQSVVGGWIERHDLEYCKDNKDGEKDCLKEVLAKTGTLLIGRELKIRGQESNLGNWVADQLLNVAKTSGKVPKDAKVVAIINSGALRFNQNLEAGSNITVRDVEELVQYDDYLYLMPVTPNELKVALDHSVNKITHGAWLQVAGFQFKADLHTKKASDIIIDGVALDQIDDNTLYVIMPRYIATPDAGDQDNYKFVAKKKHKLDSTVKAAIEAGLRNAKNGIIAPKNEGRIKLVNEAGEGLEASVEKCEK